MTRDYSLLVGVIACILAGLLILWVIAGFSFSIEFSGLAWFCCYWAPIGITLFALAALVLWRRSK
jgi:hypothetical protein